ncbi:hypothetical protein JD844_031365 [Phrynosoma platyrhinos]|uniref:Transmembrane protein 45B n=1 Tax=Phrynosoma platyrhinos TaxID=52577 RepID=A0ABQ7T0T6_PHRPL|nr:hypothetical protein JD844_031365 [Phrynosoma platyrhinos]
MGSFLGHILSGCLFLLLGLLWAVKHPLRFLGQKSKYSLQIEKLIHWVEFLEWGSMAFFCSLGGILEQYLFRGPKFHLYNEDSHKWIFLPIWQHFTMHILFAIAGVLGILTRCKFQIPVGLDYFLFSLALFNEGRVSALDQYIHYIMLIPILSGAVCSLFEVRFRNNPILELFRTSMFITQGTWLWQIAFVLYPRWGAPSWDHNDPESYMFMVMCYSWHYEAVILFLAITYGMVYWLLRTLQGGFGGPAMDIQKFNQEDTKTYTALLDGSDEE